MAMNLVGTGNKGWRNVEKESQNEKINDNLKKKKEKKRKNPRMTK